MSDERRPRRLRKAEATPPSAAALGVVKVGDDFALEFPDGDPRAAEVLATLVRVGDAMYAELERAALASFGEAQSVLNSLAVIEGAESPLTPSQVAERTFKSSGTMTATLDALVYNGWVQRVPNPDDRRSVLIEITDEGRAIIDRMLPGIRRLEQALLAELTNAERATLLKLLAKALRGAAAVVAAPAIPLEGRRNRLR